MDAKRISELRDKISLPWVSIDARWVTECLDEIERLQSELKTAQRNYDIADRMWQSEAREAMRERGYRD